MPSLFTHRAELTQRAVLAAIGLGRRAATECRKEPRTDAAVVGGEVFVAQGAPLADAEEDVHRIGRDTLDGADGLCVEAELLDVGRLFGARELGVEGLIPPRPQLGRPVDAL